LNLLSLSKPLHPAPSVLRPVASRRACESGLQPGPPDAPHTPAEERSHQHYRRLDGDQGHPNLGPAFKPGLPEVWCQAEILRTGHHGSQALAQARQVRILEPVGEITFGLKPQRPPEPGRAKPQFREEGEGFPGRDPPGPPFFGPFLPRLALRAPAAASVQRPGEAEHPPLGPYLAPRLLRAAETDQPEAPVHLDPPACGLQVRPSRLAHGQILHHPRGSEGDQEPQKQQGRKASQGPAHPDQDGQSYPNGRHPFFRNRRASGSLDARTCLPARERRPPTRSRGMAYRAQPTLYPAQAGINPRARLDRLDSRRCSFQARSRVSCSWSSSFGTAGSGRYSGSRMSSLYAATCWRHRGQRARWARTISSSAAGGASSPARSPRSSSPPDGGGR